MPSKVTEVSRTYREETKEPAVMVQELVTNGWQVQSEWRGITTLTHPQMAGHARIIEAVSNDGR